MRTSTATAARTLSSPIMCPPPRTAEFPSSSTAAAASTQPPWTFRSPTRCARSRPSPCVMSITMAGLTSSSAALENFVGQAWVDVVTGNGDGTFSFLDYYPTSIDDPAGAAIATGDFNNDGFTDVVAASQSTNLSNAGIVVMLNQLGTSFDFP